MIDIVGKKKQQTPPRPWLLQGFTPKHEKAFMAIASRFAGDLPPAAAYLLNWWITTPDGVGWLLREQSVDPIMIGNCEEVFKMCVDTARRAVIKRANDAYDGTVEIALRQTIIDALTTLGLTELY